MVMLEGKAYSDAEFLLGYIALRLYETDPALAFDHFSHILTRADTPYAKARAGYWGGRAAEAEAKSDLARKWYAAGAEHMATFYGQLAAHQLGDDAPPHPVPEPVPTATERADFDSSEQVRATQVFFALGDRADSKAFLLHLADSAKTPTQFAMLAALAEQNGRIDLAIAVAKRAIVAGTPLMIHGYPTIALPSGGNTEKALLFAIVRQESAFEPDAVSPAGARGLMQLMPATASFMAGKLQLPFSIPRLTMDGQYNVTLGRGYLEHLIDDFGGSYALAIAAYNAGPGRVRQWLAEYGDPRGGKYRHGRLDRNYPDRRDPALRAARARKLAGLSRAGRPQLGVFAGQRPRPLTSPAIRGGDRADTARRSGKHGTLPRRSTIGRLSMLPRSLGAIPAALAVAALVLMPAPSSAQTVKIGVINSYSGFVAQTADEMQKGIDLYVKEHEKDLPPGVKIELIRRDDTSKPDVGKRLAQELITRDHVQMLDRGHPVAGRRRGGAADRRGQGAVRHHQCAAGVAIPRLSPYVVRVSFTLWQESYPIGKWAAEQGWKTAYTAVSDFIPGHDSEAAFTKGFTDGGGKIVGSVRFPPANPDFTPFIQRVKDAKPDVAFLWVPGRPAGDGDNEGGQGSRPAPSRHPHHLDPGSAARRGIAQYRRCGAGPGHFRHLFGRGQAAGERGLSRRLERAYGDKAIPDFVSVDGWDGMAMIFDLIKATKGNFTADQAMAFFKNWKDPDSPRGPIMIDPRPATSSRTSISGGSKRWTASSPMSRSRRSRWSRTRGRS